MKLKLNKYNNINASDVDFNLKSNLKINNKNHIENELINTLSLYDLYDSERQKSNNFMFYGTIEYLSLLDNTYNDKNRTFANIFDKYKIEIQNNNNIKSFLNSFYFYLVTPSNVEYKNLGDDVYLRKFKVISTIDNINITPQSFANNIYGDNKYNFIFNKHLIIDDIDWFGLPVTEVFLYFVYKPTNFVGSGYGDVVFKIDENNIQQIIYHSTLAVGDIIDGDYVKYDKEKHNYVKYNSDIEYIIKTHFAVDGVLDDINKIYWKYNPFKLIKIKELNDELYNSKDIDLIPPSYAKFDEEKKYYIWRNINDYGYIDNYNDKGVLHPFANGKHYVFNNIVVSIKPDLSDNYTNNIFKDVLYNKISETNKIINFNNSLCQ